MENEKNILFIAPHPDDEVLGCGGIIKKLTDRNKNVWILVITRGKKEIYSEDKIQNVRQEALKAHTILGVSKTIFFDFPAPDLDLVSTSELAMNIVSVINDLEADTIYLPHRGDIHHDHRAVFYAGLVAARPVKNSPVKRIYTYETLSETEWAPPYGEDAFIPNRFVNICNEFPLKLEAMQCFKSQLREFPNSRSLKSIEALANFRGSTVGFTHAEAFMTIREIED
ncbi:MAG: PIG-L family deacetylase [Bacteroidales bacterium]|nr:PIG-L family deacetylase [Bacteroidales bacterium]